MSVRRIYRPEAGEPTERNRMRVHLQRARDGVAAPIKRRRLTGTLLELARSQELRIHGSDGHYSIAHARSGELVRFCGRPMTSLAIDELERFLRADGTYLWGDRQQPQDARLHAELTDVRPLDLAGAEAAPERIDAPPAASADTAAHRWSPCPAGAMALGVFRGGPLDDQRRAIPKYGPAIVRYHEDGSIHFYTHKRGTRRAYLYVGEVAK